MGFMFRVRLSSFFAGATAASVAGFYFLYKDYMLTQQGISKQVEDAYGTLDARIEVLSRRVIDLEKSKTLESPEPPEITELM